MKNLIQITPILEPEYIKKYFQSILLKIKTSEKKLKKWRKNQLTPILEPEYIREHFTSILLKNRNFWTKIKEMKMKFKLHQFFGTWIH